MCSSDGNGDVNVHTLEPDGTWGHCVTFSHETPDTSPSLCTSLRMRGHRLYCAYSTGQVHVHARVSSQVGRTEPAIACMPDTRGARARPTTLLM